MSEPLLLCRVCLAWCEPILDMCTTCASVLEVSEPDPSREQLTSRLGTVVHSLGAVDVFRTSLPSSGRLLATTTGLLFLPALQEHPRGGWMAQPAPRTPLGLWSHHLLQQLRHWLHMNGSVPPVEGAPPHGSEPADWLLDLPGALFVELTSIQKLTVRKETLRIERQPWRTLSFISLADRSELVRALGDLHRHGTWRDVLG